VSCPIYLSPATTRTKPIRLHQVWQPAPVDVDEDDLPDLGGSAPSVTRLRADNSGADGDESPAATRITLRPHDPGTGEEIEKREVVKGYEYSRGQFLTFTAEELKALDVESSKVVDLEKFVAGDDIDPVYFDSPYFVYPDGPIAVEVLRVIGAAMAKVGVVGLGRLTLSRRERMVVVEPRGTGMALFTLRAAGEVRAPQFGSAEGDLDTEMVAIAGAIIRQRTGNFDPSTYHDRYQEALQQLIEGEDERGDHRAADGINAIAGDRFNGCPQTQPCAGTVRAGAKNGKKEANQKGTRSTSAGIALALNRGSQKKSTALVRRGCH
jgi:Ku protein